MSMSKVLVAISACALGVCAFAAVEGNNTAVIVRKPAVTSGTGWQYLSIPVRGFDITGQGSIAGVAIQDLLPPASYAAGTELIVEYNPDNEAYLDNGNYTLGTVEGTSAWVDGGGSDVGSQLLVAAARVWVKDPAKASTQTSNALAALMGKAEVVADTTALPAVNTFAGEQNAEVEYLISEKVGVQVNGMTPCGNFTSESVALLPAKEGTTVTTGTTQLVENPQDYDQILRIVDGVNAYIYYEYVASYDGNPGYWYLMGVKESDFETRFTGNFDPYTIQPGEAFYYYRKSAVAP